MGQLRFAWDPRRITTTRPDTPYALAVGIYVAVLAAPAVVLAIRQTVILRYLRTKFDLETVKTTLIQPDPVSAVISRIFETCRQMVSFVRPIISDISRSDTLFP